MLISDFLCYFMHFFNIKGKNHSDMRKHILFSLLVFLSIQTAFAQQEPQFSQNMFNIMSFNPGYIGSGDAICATLLARQQWTGFTETINGQTNNVSPQTVLFSLDGAINPIRGGLGMVVYKDKLGYEDNIGFKFGYAYRRPMFNGYLGIGLMAGFLNKKIDFTQFVAIDPNDPLLQGTSGNDMLFDFSLGLYYNMPGVFYAGLSSSQMLQAQSDFGTNLGSPQLKRHYYLVGGYQYTLPNNPSIELRPSLMIKSDLSKTQYDVNLLGVLNSQFWGGLSWRRHDAIVVILGAQPFINAGNGLVPLKIGYSYDVTTSALGASGRSSGSHEIMLNYCFKIVFPHEPTQHGNVRFLG